MVLVSLIEGLALIIINVEILIIFLTPQTYFTCFMPREKEASRMRKQNEKKGTERLDFFPLVNPNPNNFICFN